MAELTPTPNRARQPRRRPRWLRFSLRTLLVLMLLLSVALAWLRVEMKRAQEQAAMVRRIREMGGTVIYDHQMVYANKFYRGSAPAYDSKKEPTGNELVRRLLGNDFLDKVVQVHFGPDSYFTSRGMVVSYQPSHLTDEQLAQLDNLPDLEVVVLLEPDTTDAGLMHLAKFKSLRAIRLRGAKITDEAVRKLQAALPDCQITVFPPPP
ncbi:MAG: hypothetical protein HYS13_08170 [Planctomycetia bacterium]|nr:hypothetical protein [Planctomycetia bacterium]